MTKRFQVHYEYAPSTFIVYEENIWDAISDYETEHLNPPTALITVTELPEDSTQVEFRSSGE